MATLRPETAASFEYLSPLSPWATPGDPRQSRAGQCSEASLEDDHAPWSEAPCPEDRPQPVRLFVPRRVALPPRTVRVRAPRGSGGRGKDGVGRAGQRGPRLLVLSWFSPRMPRARACQHGVLGQVNTSVHIGSPCLEILSSVPASGYRGTEESG